MSNEMKSELGAKSTLQMSADVNQNKETYSNGNNISSVPEELIEREEIENTPFHMIGNKERGYFIGMGKYRISKEFKHPDELSEYLETNFYNVVFQMALTIHEIIAAIPNETKE